MIIIAILLVTMSSGFVEAEEIQRKTRTPLTYRNQYQAPEAPTTSIEPAAKGQVNQRPARQEHNPAYKPFAMAPSHIRQLIYDAYGPQQPYVNPHSFFYKNYIGLPEDFLTSEDAHNRRADEDQPSVSSTPSPISYGTGYPENAQTIAKIHSNSLQRGGIKYKHDDQQYQQSDLFSPQQNYGLRDSFRTHRNSDQTKRSPESELSDDSQGYQMPNAIQTLLQYQAQIPYNVLANHIIFDTKKPFIPKPLPNELLSASPYPNKIFYIKADGQILDQVPAMGISGGEIKYKNP